MGDVDQLFDCFDDEVEEKQLTLPIVIEIDPKEDENE